MYITLYPKSGNTIYSSNTILCIVKHPNMVVYLLSIDDLEPLLHLATLCAQALLVGDQGDVGVVWDAVVACAAVNTVLIVIITQVIIAAAEGLNYLFKVSSIKIYFPSRVFKEEIYLTLSFLYSVNEQTFV